MKLREDAKEAGGLEKVTVGRLQNTMLRCASSNNIKVGVVSSRLELEGGCSVGLHAFVCGGGAQPWGGVGWQPWYRDVAAGEAGGGGGGFGLGGVEGWGGLGG